MTEIELKRGFDCKIIGIKMYKYLQNAKLSFFIRQ